MGAPLGFNMKNKKFEAKCAEYGTFKLFYLVVTGSLKQLCWPRKVLATAADTVSSHGPLKPQVCSSDWQRKPFIYNSATVW